MREQVIEFFKEEINQYNNFVSQVRNDSLGRFFASKDGRKNNAFNLSKSIFTEEQFIDYLIDRIVKNNTIKSDDAPQITVLVGPPACGKSTWREANQGDTVVISRDDLMIEFAQSFDSNETMTYSDVWKYLEENDLHKEVDGIVQEKFKQAVKERKNIVIDQTNMSRKSRRKWLNNVPKDYSKRAIVFATSYEEIFKRNEKREKETGKTIQNWIITSMMKQFMVPMYDEVHTIEWVF